MLFRLAKTCGKRIEEQQRWSACWRVPDHSAEGERQPRVHPPVHRPDRPQAHSQGDTIRYFFLSQNYTLEAPFFRFWDFTVFVGMYSIQQLTLAQVA